MGHLILVRGLPGSGKTTFADSLRLGFNANMFEADDFFTDDNGDYHYDSNYIKSAHITCQKNVTRIMQKYPGATIIVSNTFSKKIDMACYFKFCEHYGYEITVLTMNGHFNSIHSVPEYVVERMRAEFDHDLSDLFA